MDLNVKFTGRDALVRDILSIVGPAGRHGLFSVGAKALQAEVQRHVRNAARSRHKWSTMLGAKPTGHLTRGARAITWHHAGVRRPRHPSSQRGQAHDPGDRALLRAPGGRAPGSRLEVLQGP